MPKGDVSRRFIAAMPPEALADSSARLLCPNSGAVRTRTTVSRWIVFMKLALMGEFVAAIGERVVHGT